MRVTIMPGGSLFVPHGWPSRMFITLIDRETIAVYPIARWCEIERSLPIELQKLACYTGVECQPDEYGAVQLSSMATRFLPQGRSEYPCHRADSVFLIDIRA